MSELGEVTTPKTAGFVARGGGRMSKKIEQDEKELEELIKQSQGQAEPDPDEDEDEDEVVETKSDNDEGKEELSEEEKTYKKRYGDLRRHMQKKLDEQKEEFEAKLEEVKQGSGENVRPPASDEDLEAWASKYPDIASIVEAVAEKKAKAMFDQADEKLKDLERANVETKRTRAENAIRKAHPDFDDIVADDAFHDWAETQPQVVQDALYKNEDDADSVIWVLNSYKGVTTAKTKKDKKEAAKEVSRNKSDNIDTEGGVKTIRESEVAKWTPQEFEKREEELKKAIKAGKFVYDVTSGAR